MGEIADMMINGDICEQCGLFLESDGDGYPRTCTGCGGDTPEFRFEIIVDSAAREKHIMCDDQQRRPNGCHKKFKTVEAAQQHYRDVHK